MSVEEKQITIAQNVPKVFNKGYEKGKAENGTAKEEQEKTIEITENGTTEVLPDESKTLSKVTVDVQVENGFDYDAYFEQKFNEITKNGTSTSYLGQACFSGFYVDDITFKPTYDIKPTNASSLFKCSRITNLTKILKDRNVVLDTSNCTSFTECFANSTITHLPTISLLGIPFGGKAFNIFLAAHSLLFVEKLIIRKDIVWTNSDFTAKALTTIAEIEGEIGTSFNISSCSKLDDLTIDNIINAYADMTGQTAPILTVHPDVKAKIEVNETWLNTLINKNVTLA